MRDGGKGAGEDRGDGKGSDDDLKCSCPVSYPVWEQELGGHRNKDVGTKIFSP